MKQHRSEEEVEKEEEEKVEKEEEEKVEKEGQQTTLFLDSLWSWLWS